MQGKAPTCVVSTDVLTSHYAMDFLLLALHEFVYMGKGYDVLLVYQHVKQS